MEKLIERKRKRRESHNVVERKRRDNINARIDELSTLLPPQHQSPQKLNRGIILQNSVNHIRALHQRVAEQQERIQQLEAMLNGKSRIDQGNQRYHQHHQHQQQQQQQPSDTIRNHPTSNETLPPLSFPSNHQQ
ncbi:Myc-type, basic helix-loop-helix domain-containing protein [Chlamydoabsidia padenii]|nr:Myc-type, basic helix-loop-helix domain-containing protein [Chlamydoabsidia padenii]